MNIDALIDVGQCVAIALIGAALLMHMFGPG